MEINSPPDTWQIIKHCLALSFVNVSLFTGGNAVTESIVGSWKDLQQRIKRRGRKRWSNMEAVRGARRVFTLQSYYVAFKFIFPTRIPTRRMAIVTPPDTKMLHLFLCFLWMRTHSCTYEPRAFIGFLHFTSVCAEGGVDLPCWLQISELPDFLAEYRWGGGKNGNPYEDVQSWSGHVFGKILGVIPNLMMIQPLLSDDSVLDHKAAWRPEGVLVRRLQELAPVRGPLMIWILASSSSSSSILSCLTDRMV